MSKTITAALFVLVALGGAAGSVSAGSYADKRLEAQTRVQAIRTQQARQANAQARAAHARRSSVASAMITVATLNAADAGECSPYLARWMQTKSLYWRIQYETCMDD